MTQERETLRQRLEKDFPEYFELVSPRPASLADVRGALAPGEVLVASLITATRTFLWAVPRDGEAAFAVSELNGRQAAAMVGKLRSALDIGQTDLFQAPAFDLATAHTLYQQLLAPLEKQWQGADSLLVVTNGALSQLPFSLLVTAASAPAAQSLRFAELREVPWLIRQVAVSQLPSAATIVTLRHARPGSAVRRDFIGFGDPDFGGGRRPAVHRGITIRNLDFKRPPPPKSGVAVAPAWLDYSRIPALPDTRDEILAIARALHADPITDVRLGKAASLKNAHSAELARRRIVAFATHGLLPGDFPGVDQPSLALANPGGGRLGLLTLEQILGLKLDADWVVLSACNTAAGDGAGAEAISGLGRGFFYAGSRALLVTHWPVETVSARLLVSGVFSRYGSDPSLSRAQALRLSILDLIDSAGAVNPKTGKADFSYAHPLFWAPYVVVGDGGRTTIP